MLKFSLGRDVFTIICLVNRCSLIGSGYTFTPNGIETKLFYKFGWRKLLAACRGLNELGRDVANISRVHAGVRSPWQPIKWSSTGQVSCGGTGPRLTEHLPGTSKRATRRWLRNPHQLLQNVNKLNHRIINHVITGPISMGNPNWEDTFSSGDMNSDRWPLWMPQSERKKFLLTVDHWMRSACFHVAEISVKMLATAQAQPDGNLAEIVRNFRCYWYSHLNVPTWRNVWDIPILHGNILKIWLGGPRFL